MFSGLFSTRAVSPTYSRLQDDPAESAPLTCLEAAEARAKQDAERAVELEHAKARFEAAVVALQVKRQAATDACDLLALQARKNLAEAAREKAEREAQAATQCTQRSMLAQFELDRSRQLKRQAARDAMELVIDQLAAAYRACVSAEKAAEQQLHAAEQQVAAAQRAKTDSAAAAERARRAARAARIQQPVPLERKAQ